MDLTRIQKLAGVKDVFLEKELRDNEMLNEAVVIPEDSSLDQLALMFDAAKRAMGLVNRLKNPADRKKHLKAVFSNINKIRAALGRMIAKQDA